MGLGLGLLTALRLRLRALLTPRQLLCKLRNFTAQLLLLAHQPLQLPALLFLCHLLFATCQIALRPGQTFLASGQLFQLVDLFLVFLGTATGAVGSFVAILQLSHFHLEQLPQIFPFLLGTAASATTTLLHADVGAVNARLCSE